MMLAATASTIDHPSGCAHELLYICLTTSPLLRDILAAANARNITRLKAA